MRSPREAGRSGRGVATRGGPLVRERSLSAAESDPGAERRDSSSVKRAPMDQRGSARVVPHRGWRADTRSGGDRTCALATGAGQRGAVLDQQGRRARSLRGLEARLATLGSRQSPRRSGDDRCVRARGGVTRLPRQRRGFGHRPSVCRQGPRSMSGDAPRLSGIGHPADRIRQLAIRWRRGVMSCTESGP